MATLLAQPHRDNGRPGTPGSGRMKEKASGGGQREPLPPPAAASVRRVGPLRSRFLRQRRGVVDRHRATLHAAGQVVAVGAEGDAETTVDGAGTTARDGEQFGAGL